MWISSSLELSIKPRDSVGRIPYSEMIFARNEISARKPYAAMMMAWLEHTLRRRRVNEPPPKAPSPAVQAEHLVICSHDIDVYLTSMFSRLMRLFKNFGIAALNYKSWFFFSRTAKCSGKRSLENRLQMICPGSRLRPPVGIFVRRFLSLPQDSTDAIRRIQSQLLQNAWKTVRLRTSL
jgi:hypothetical protein